MSEDWNLLLDDFASEQTVWELCIMWTGKIFYSDNLHKSPTTICMKALLY